MKTVLLFFLGSVLVFKAVAQDTPTKSVEEIFQQRNPTHARALLAGKSVRYLALDYPGGRKRFFAGDRIRFRLRGARTRYDDVIQSVSDSSFSFLTFNEITQRGETVDFRLQDVANVRVTRRVPFISQGMVLFPIAGILYFVSDVFHPRSGSEKAITTGTAVVTGSLFGLGYLGHRLTFPTYKLKPNGRKRLKVLRTY
ncbi:MAG: hypothetical protein LH606_06620 [Cytophagaceae bacterium]|nr:hypothetical protein [Cytophagaceae bacterium]